MNDPFFGTSGPRGAEIVLIGESWGREEEAQRCPFVGPSGQELRKIAAEAGFDLNTFFLTNVVPVRPPNNEMWRLFVHPKKGRAFEVRGLHPTPVVQKGLENLTIQLSAVRPKLIIAVGNYALWATTNCTKHSSSGESEGVRRPSGIESWRGSMWYADALPGPLGKTPLLPIIHPAAIMRAWYQRAITVHDLRVRIPKRDAWRPNPTPIFLAPPTFSEAVSVLDGWKERVEREPMRLVNDIETARKLMTCIGFADSASFAMTIPWVRLSESGFESYWTLEEEHALATRIRYLLRHKNCLVEGQNYLYDTQYLAAQMGCMPRLDFDTMLAQHLLFPGTPKGLDYLSSLYCEHHWYWKEEGKEWDIKGDLESHLRYNSLDCIKQFEVGTVLRHLIVKGGMEEQFSEQMHFNALALRMMRRGVRIDTGRRSMLAVDLALASKQLGDWLLKIIPQDEVKPKAKTPWFRSATQCREFFGNTIGLNLPRHRKTGNITFGKEALKMLAERHPELIRLFDSIRDYRSLQVFHSTFIEAPLDYDQRMRCSYNTSGTETFRWSSSENVFGSGTNLQNVPEGTEDP